MSRNTKSLCTNCVQHVGGHGQKSADKRTQVIPPSNQNNRYHDFWSDNPNIYTPAHTLFTRLFPQTKTTILSLLKTDLSHFSTIPTITTITYI